MVMVCRVRVEAAAALVSELRALEAVVKRSQWRFFGSSLLLIFEGAPDDEDGDDDDDDDDDNDDDDDQRAKRAVSAPAAAAAAEACTATVKAIDFANVIPGSAPAWVLDVERKRWAEGGAAYGEAIATDELSSSPMHRMLGARARRLPAGSSSSSSSSVSISATSKAKGRGGEGGGKGGGAQPKSIQQRDALEPWMRLTGSDAGYLHGLRTLITTLEGIIARAEEEEEEEEEEEGGNEGETEEEEAWNGDEGTLF